MDRQLRRNTFRKILLSKHNFFFDILFPKYLLRFRFIPIKMKFLVDKTMWRLSRWLRILGYDSKNYPDVADRDFLNAAWNEGRIALTRKSESKKRNYRGELVVVEDDRIENQIAYLYNILPLNPNPDLFFSRCLNCNVLLETIEKENIKLSIPEYVYSTQKEFKQCSSCGKIYWAGTHRERALEFIRRHIPSDRPESFR